MKILITGFEPFAGLTINPTEQLVKDVKNLTFPDVEIESAVLPVVYDHCVEALINKVEAVNPDYVICCGLALGRAEVTIERIGINIKDTAGEGLRGDNQGDKPSDKKIIEDGPDGLFSTLPIRLLVNELKKNRIPAQISNTAGTYICNNTLYGILHYIQKKQLHARAGFIHFPAIPEMVVEKTNVPSMSLQLQLQALIHIIEVLKRSN